MCDANGSLQGEVLRRFEGVKGYGFFNSWTERRTGEVGPLLKPEETREMWTKAYYSIGQA